jgi:hypothetical protein
METLGKVLDALVRYGPTAIEALAWLGDRLVRWLGGETDEDVQRVADILPEELRSRLALKRGRAEAAAMLRDKLDDGGAS